PHRRCHPGFGAGCANRTWFRSSPSPPRSRRDMMPHVSICICTYKRPQLLARLLKELGQQETDSRLTYSIVIADNDQSRSADAVVSGIAVDSPMSVVYVAEPQQNISLARNKAMENATGDFIAFIDDDEFPASGWLVTLFEACAKYDDDGFLGPGKCQFAE